MLLVYVYDGHAGSSVVCVDVLVEACPFEVWLVYTSMFRYLCFGKGRGVVASECMQVLGLHFYLLHHGAHGSGITFVLFGG